MIYIVCILATLCIGLIIHNIYLLDEITKEIKLSDGAIDQLIEMEQKLEAIRMERQAENFFRETQTNGAPILTMTEAE